MTKTIFLVDDVASLRRMVAGYLRRDGLRMVAAADGHDLYARPVAPPLNEGCVP